MEMLLAALVILLVALAVVYFERRQRMLTKHAH